ncbi:MAG: hypothetical protein A2010_14895 [Nitrospirae bacterium GWD2_57_9]|nr:MAG: hypothetical protein A2010_14895 [Nitrospirae bacterium GWD2_57_9]OGW48523.1 MAG: hypothetical protein A2078_02530 [Nitrospirae bacterium GWC2_57_9]
MISSFVARVLIVLLLALVLVPAAARSQEQTNPGTTPGQGETADVPPLNADGNAAPDQQSPTSFTPADAEAEAEKTSSQPEPQQRTTSLESVASSGTYIIKQGDTLWDISNSFLRDPFLWPFIWKANPSITNPDLIYPGNTLVIPNMAPIERALQAPAAPEQARPVRREEAPDHAFGRRLRSLTPPPVTDEEAPNSTLVLPEETKQALYDKYRMLGAGFVDIADSKDILVGGPEEKTIYAYDDLVYIKIRSKENASIGDKFLIYRAQDKVRHPVTGARYGYVIKVYGILQITAKDKHDIYTARITYSFDAGIPGKMKLMPYQEPVLLYNDTIAKDKDLAGRILAVSEEKTLNGQIDVVYLDKGSADGVEPGDRFLVYRRQPARSKEPRKMIGEMQVILVKERTATAIINKSTEMMGAGDVVESRK